MEKNARVILREAYEHLADELDVPPSKYKEAQDHYTAVGNWLNQDDTPIANYGPDIYPQGSFALGTVVKPLEGDEYDVDAVCILNGAVRDDISQEEVKKLVGDRLKQNERYAQMLDPCDGGRRCWTLKYADSSRFHLDILPSIPDPDKYIHASSVPFEHLETAICVTDKTTWDEDSNWPTENRSNPKGYLKWFKKRMEVAFQQRKQLIVEARRSDGGLVKAGEVEDVPDYEVRTPLQRLIQVLKRHRDQHYGTDDDRPISIIITTLAAHAYDNQANLLDAMLDVVPKMKDYIEDRDGVWWVPNPVNPDENFADKWEESPRKADLFFQWIHKVENDHTQLLEPGGIQKASELLTESYGQRDASRAITKTAGLNSSPPGMLANAVNWVAARFNVGHREKPNWSYSLNGYEVTLSAQISRNGWRTRDLHNDGAPVPPGCSLSFKARTNVPKPYRVYWQVVNTGTAAKNAGDLRGEIIDAQIHRGGLSWTRESTKYPGNHWIECFIVCGDVCVARSGEFVIHIK